MTKIIGSPTRYIQGSGELKTIAKHVNVIGDHMFILVDKNIKDITACQASQTNNTSRNAPSIYF